MNGKGTPGRSRRDRLGPAAALLVLWGLAGCSQPLMDGAQVPGRPEGFVFDANSSAARKVFPDRQVLDQRSYFTVSGEYSNSIMITEYAGETGYEEVQAAREAAEARYGGNTAYGPIDATVIDKRPAWTYLVTQRYRGDISSLTYTAVVSYGKTGRTYSVEFHASDPRYMDEALLAGVVKSFTVR